MSREDPAKDKLWSTLVEAVHALVMYPNHKAYTREFILLEKPEITAEELAARLKLPLGEALVILYELADERKTQS